MKRVTYILLFLFLSITIYAQRAPITVTTILTPPYTTSLSTMAESGSTRLMVNLLVNDVTITEIPVKLHIKMESAGITVESIPTQAVRPMFLGGGEARVLTGDDFAEYLNLNNLNFKGFSKEAYIKNGQLPAGLWKFSVSVRHFYTNKTISNIGTVTAWITSYKPPVLTTPKDGEIAPSNAALPLTFSWQASKHTGGTAAIMYRFEMWERRIEGVPAQAVAASVPPIFTTETAGLTATVLPATLALEPGMKYCWRVTAYDPSGMVTIENKGESEVRTFQYLEKCPEVCGLTVDIKDDTGYASWEENRQHLGGYNFEFYDDEGTCHKTLWGSSTKTAGIGGEYGKTWHVRVQGLCRSSVEGPWSDWVDFKIPDAFKPLKDEIGNTYECGREVPERVITNFELIDNIQKGDTLEDERGTTKYIIHSATKNEDGSFRGLSYMKLSIWGVKVLGEYNNMKVNTDGVIIGRYAWKSVKSDLLVADPEAIEKWADELALEMAGATYNNTIKDTIVLSYSRGYVNFETIEREGGKYYAVTSDGHKEEITSFINGQKRVMVKDGDGHELVIDKDGNVMGVEEYTKCGGSKALLRENIKEKDSQVTKSGNVKFFSAGKHLFDTYDDYTNAAKGYAERFPSIGEGDYRPAYACAESNTKIEIKAAPYANLTFKNERGVPLICKDGILEVTARGDRDTTSIYAYDADNHIVGKVNVLSYDKVTRKICLVPIGDTKAPDASAVKQGLDEIFAKLMVDFEVTIGEPISIQYAKNNKFTHGGSGMIGVYNTDQKAAISKLKERGIDNETVYLFLAECSINNQLDENDKIQVVNGYMPRGYQFGFIYNEFNNYRTDAHEICHGAFHLKHTFAQDDFLAAERTTDNLMDYNDGKTLNHWQWKDIHQPKSVRFKWLQDEEGAESISTNRLIVKFENSELPQQTGEAAFLTLAGLPIAFDDMSLMQEMYFTGKKIEEETDINGQPVSLMTADRSLLVAFNYDGVFYTPQIDIINENKDEENKKSENKYVLKGYLGDEYYVSKPNTTTNNIVWWYNNKKWEEIQFKYDPSKYYNATLYNEEYLGANYFATFIERRLDGVNGNGLTYIDRLKDLDQIDFFDSKILPNKNSKYELSLLRIIKDVEGNNRLICTIVNKDNLLTKHYEYDYVLEDWRATEVANISDLPFTPELVGNIAKRLGHDILDAIGIVPFAGEVSDLVNATWYLIEADYKNAALSATSMLPLIGDYAAKTIVVVKGQRLLKTIDFSADAIHKFQLAIKDCKVDFYADFADASEDVLRKFVEKPELVDVWKKLKDCPDAIRKNVSLLEDMSSCPKGWKYKSSVDGGVVVENTSGTKLATIYEDRIVAESRVLTGERGNQLLNMEKLVRNMRYEVDGIEYYTDALGRVERTKVDLKAHIDIVEKRANGTANTRLGNQQTRAVDIKDGEEVSDQGGHIIAARFSGPGEQINLYPQSATLNQGAWKDLESEWAKALGEGKNVEVEIKAIFDGESKRPSSFEVEYSIDGIIDIEKFNNL